MGTMQHSEFKGHRIATEARQVGDRWRGYYRVDDGMFQATIAIARNEEDAHIRARIQAEATVHKLLDAKGRR